MLKSVNLGGCTYWMLTVPRGAPRAGTEARRHETATIGNTARYIHISLTGSTNFRVGCFERGCDRDCGFNQESSFVLLRWGCSTCQPVHPKSGDEELRSDEGN